MKVGDKFKSVISGDIVTVIEIYEKTKQIIVEEENGKTRAYSSPTLKNKDRFVPVEDDSDYVAEVMQQKKELGIECPKIESYEVVGETSADREQETSPDCAGMDVKDFIIKTATSIGAEICEAPTKKFISFKVGGKMFAAIFSFSKKAATLGVRGKAIEGLTPDKVMNHMMDYRFTFDSLSDKNKDMILSILEASKDYQLNKNK